MVTVIMRKINGLTGAVIWEQKWPCSIGDEKASGGIVSQRRMLAKDEFRTL